jgi:GNAT superfamily N-acetyltransferase
MTANVRPARQDEIPTLIAMYEWLFEPPGYRPEAWDADRAGQALREAISGAESIVLVADAESGALVGLITAYIELHSVRFGLRCWVEDLVVDPSQRSAGLGKALLHAAKAWAKDRGATHLELDTGIARTSAQNFYERESPISRGYSYTWAL